MLVLKIIGAIAKNAFGMVVNDAKNQLIPPVIQDFTKKQNRQQRRSKQAKFYEREPLPWEKKVHEILVLLFSIINSILSLIKLIRACIPNKIWRSPYQ